MSATFRLFNNSVEDAERILEVESVCWNESSHSPESLRSVLVDATNPQSCWLAETGQRVVGFIHAFLTYFSGAPVWDVDLVAVHPDFRGRGIATELINRALRSAPHEAVSARSFIARDNRGSQSAFLRAGFKQSAEPHYLYALDIASTSARGVAVSSSVTIERTHRRTWQATLDHHKLRFAEVHAILQSGLWVDGYTPSTPTALLDAIRQHTRQRDLTWIDVTLPSDGSGEARPLLQRGYISLGQYNIWDCALAGR